MANTRASLFVFLPACTLMLVQTLVRLSTARPVMSVTGQLRRSLARAPALFSRPVIR